MFKVLLTFKNGADALLYAGKWPRFVSRRAREPAQSFGINIFRMTSKNGAPTRHAAKRQRPVPVIHRRDTASLVRARRVC